MKNASSPHGTGKTRGMPIKLSHIYSNSATLIFQISQDVHSFTDNLFNQMPWFLCPVAVRMIPAFSISYKKVFIHKIFTDSTESSPAPVIVMDCSKLLPGKAGRFKIFVIHIVFQKCFC